MPKHPNGMAKKNSIGTAWERIQYARARHVRGSKITPHTARRQFFGRTRPVKFRNTEITNFKNEFSEERVNQLINKLSQN